FLKQGFQLTKGAATKASATSALPQGALPRGPTPRRLGLFGYQAGYFCACARGVLAAQWYNGPIGPHWSIAMNGGFVILERRCEWCGNARTVRGGTEGQHVCFNCRRAWVAPRRWSPLDPRSW